MYGRTNANRELLETSDNPTNDIDVPAHLINSDESTGETSEDGDVVDHADSRQQHSNITGPDLFIKDMRVTLSPTRQTQEGVIESKEVTSARVVVVVMSSIRAVTGVNIKEAVQIERKSKN